MSSFDPRDPRAHPRAKVRHEPWDVLAMMPATSVLIVVSYRWGSGVTAQRKIIYCDAAECLTRAGRERSHLGCVRIEARTKTGERWTWMREESKAETIVRRARASR